MSLCRVCANALHNRTPTTGGPRDACLPGQGVPRGAARAARAAAWPQQARPSGAHALQLPLCGACRIAASNSAADRARSRDRPGGFMAHIQHPAPPPGAPCRLSTRSATAARPDHRGDALVVRFMYIELGTALALLQVSWLLTWFAHTVPDYDSICRLFDLFLSANPLMPLYIGVAAMCASRQVLLQGECEYAEVHRQLSNLPALAKTPEEGGTPVVTLIRAARVLATRVPPRSLLTASPVRLDSHSAVAAWPYDWMSLPQRPDKVLRRMHRPEATRNTAGWGGGRVEVSPSPLDAQITHPSTAALDVRSLQRSRTPRDASPMSSLTGSGARAAAAFNDAGGR